VRFFSWEGGGGGAHTPVPQAVWGVGVVFFLLGGGGGGGAQAASADQVVGLGLPGRTVHLEKPVLNLV
jgi:hypothetical protein